MFSQCTPQTFLPQFIYTDSTVTASLIIEDADINDLSDPAQGVCGVKLNFTHDNVREMIVKLISPSGQEVDLIGPISPTAQQTFNSEWNISYLPCNDAPIPDPGFSGTYTNEDPWFSFGFGNEYLGSYYPNVGCLEDFDSGPVNGLWSLEIFSFSQFYEGELLSFEIQFCDDNFICQQCVADPGSFAVIDLPTEYCEGEPSLLFDLALQFPEVVDYGLEFYILQDDMILDRQVAPDLTSYDAGEYQICGLSFYEPSVSLIPTTSSFSDLNTLFNSARSPLCAKFTEECFTFNILAYSDTLTIDTTICQGSFFTYNGESYNTAGEIRTSIGSSMCDTLVLIDLNTVDLNAIISNNSDLLTCDNDTISLSIGSSALTPNTRITWETINGSIIGDVNDTLVQVTQEGQYWLVLEEGECVSTDLVTINADAGLPNLEIVLPDTLTCARTSVDLRVNSTPSAIAYAWTGPDGFTETDETIEVSIPGIYSVNVMLPTGCSSTISQEVYSDFIAPDLEILISDISCDRNFGEVEILDRLADTRYDYPGGTINMVTGMIEYPMEGDYTISVTSLLNGCSEDSMFTISSDIQLPTLSFEPVDSIDCSNLTVDLTVVADIPVATYGWVGPNGPLPDEGNTIKVGDAGTYEALIIAENGCRNSLTQEVVAVSADLPNISITADTLTCNSTTVTINTEVDRAGLRFNWFDGRGFTSSDEDPIVSAAGKYYLEASVSSNCVILDSIIVEENLSTPALNIEANALTCVVSTSELMINDQEDGVSYEWSDPAGVLLIGEQPLVQDAGQYSLEAIGINGCRSTTALEVVIDTMRPVAIANSDRVLKCDTKQVDLSGEGSSVGDNFTYAWSTSDGSIIARANTLAPLVGSAGTYLLNVTNEENGCESTGMTILEEASSDLSDLDFEKFDPPCSGTATGSITAGEVVGGVAPFTYSIDGFNYQSSPIFDDLPASTYKLSVKDDFGCGFSENVTLQDGLDVSVVLEDTYEVNLGDELEIISTINTNGDQLRTIEWDLSDQAIANGVETVNVRPLTNAVVEVSISTESGCEDITTALINVTKERDIYTPNVVDLTSFGDNSEFKVFATNAIEEITSINIYDRWGNEVFNTGPHDPKVETKAWDGTHKSQNLIPGVYVYLIEVLLIDGEQRKKSGDILLIR